MKLHRFLLSFFLLLSVSGYSKELIKVGGYEFPPYVESESDSEFTGISIQMIKILNKVQNEYQFQFVETSAMRRYKDIVEGNYELILFEDTKWGWKPYLKFLDVSTIMAIDAERYITAKSEGVNQSYFKNLKDKSKIVMFGYHYPYSKFQTDSKILLEKYQTTLAHSQSSILKAVASRHKDIGIITHSYMENLYQTNKKIKSKLLISNKKAQTYKLRSLLRKVSKLPKSKWEKILAKAIQTNEYKELLNKYKINH